MGVCAQEHFTPAIQTSVQAMQTTSRGKATSGLAERRYRSFSPAACGARVSKACCFQDLERKLLQVLEQAGVFARWFVVGRKELFCNIGGQSMTFIHSDL